MSFDFDLFVIGGGSGGVRAARMAAATGARVALAEESRMGGTCVIRGCVPKKLMVYASGFGEMISEARGYGWDIPDGRFDWPAFRAKLHAELDRLEAVYRRLLQGSNVTIHDQRARITGPHRVALADGTEITAAHILIATGGRPERPAIAGADLALVSDDVFGLQSLPDSLCILGGGFIACEMAAIFAGLGVRVTLAYRGDQILRGFDAEARGLLADGLRARGVDVRLHTDAARLDKLSGGVQVAWQGGGADSFGAVLAATGRRPNTGNLGLENIGLKPQPNGALGVDSYSQTQVPSVFAIGDVTGRVALTPVAIREGMAFVRTVFDGIPTPVDHDLIPMAVFTQPELGTIGLTEDAARAREKIDVYTTSFRPMRSAFAGGEDRVFMKLVVSQATDRVLGCHIIAPDAGEMIQLAAIAIKMGATKADFDRTVAVHPTMAEELVTMRSPTRRDS